MSPPSPLSCHETFERLADYVDRELTQEEMQQVREHLDRCAVCTREYRFEASVLDALRAKIRRIQVPPDLVTRISEAIARERRPDPHG